MDRTDDRTRHFFSVFRNRMAQLRSLDLSLNGGLYHKTLSVCMLDTLAKAAFRTNRNKERLTRFVREFTGWPDVNRVSLPYIDAVLRKYPDVQCAKLRAFVYERFSPWRYGCLPLRCDPEFAEVAPLWPNELDPFGRISLEHLRHDHLFYVYRNALVHEVRSPGFASEEESDAKPYYHTASLLGQTGQWWELVYPTRFFLTILDESLDRLEAHCKASAIDPTEAFEFGTYWLSELDAEA